MVMGETIAVHGTQQAASQETRIVGKVCDSNILCRQQWQCQYVAQGIGVCEYLDTREDHQQLQSKVRQLKHNTAAFSTPLLLPAVEPVGNQAPTEAD